jgi:hypothetical protein
MSRGRARRALSVGQRPGKAAWLAVGFLAVALTAFWMASHRSDTQAWVAGMKAQCQARYARAFTARDTAAVDLTSPEYSQGGFRGALSRPEALSCGELRVRDWQLP